MTHSKRKSYIYITWNNHKQTMKLITIVRGNNIIQPLLLSCNTVLEGKGVGEGKGQDVCEGVNLLYRPKHLQFYEEIVKFNNDLWNRQNKRIFYILC